MKSDIEQSYIADIISSRYPTSDLPEGIVEIGDLTRSPEQFSANATKREGGVGFVAGAAPAPMSSSSTAQVSQPRFGRAGVTAEQSAAAGGLEKPITALADMLAGIPRGMTAQTMGLGGDLESLYNGLTSIFNRPEDQPRIDAFLQGLAQKTNMATTEQINKEGYRIPFTDINMPPLPPVVPVGSPDQKSREASANYGQFFGELAPIPSIIDVGVTGLKAGAKALAPNAANMMEQGLRKSGMITDIVPDGKSAAQQAPKSDIGFYSAVENAAINVQRKSGAGQSFLNDIMKGENVKAEEIKWMGLDDFLKGKKNVTKQEVQDYIANNKVDVQEVQLGERVGSINKNSKYATPEVIRIVTQNQGSADNAALIALDNDYNAYKEITNKFPEFKDNPDWAEIVLNDVTGTFANVQGIPKYKQYTLAGGENYREILLTMPIKNNHEINSLTQQIRNQEEIILQANRYANENPEELANMEIKRNRAQQKINEFQEKINQLGGQISEYKSGHFEQPNILAHLRVNDRVDADGKKMLLIEEIQSDWHQAGRDKGYKSANANKEIKLLEDEMTSNGEKIRSIMSEMMGLSKNSEKFKKLNNDRLALIEQQTILNDKGNALLDKQSYGVPDAPFKDTWYQLALKRALQYAAENGYERVGLTTGKQQAARFNLSNQVDALYPIRELDGTYTIDALRKDHGDIINVAQNIKEENISDYVGKEIANKILKEKLELGEDFEISGLDLQVGGEGMKKYYDEIYPKFLEKYGKKWNAKMGETKIQTERSRDSSGIPSMYQDKETVRYIDITPEMKAGVQKGQPLFAAAPIGAATGAATMQDERKK